MLLGIQLVDSTTITQIVLLALAFILSAVIGLERQRRLKSAGLRTHTLVGIGSALFTLVSAYGFSAVIGTDVVLDPSRIAAQIVSGIGFLGAGVIFVRRGGVSGLTTAASIWVTAAVGMACGAGMPIVAVVATGFFLLTVTGLARVGRWLSRNTQEDVCVIEYKDGRGVLRDVLEHAHAAGFDISLEAAHVIPRPGKTDRVEARLRLHGRGPVDDFLDELAELRGVTQVEVAPPSHEWDRTPERTH